MASAEPEVQVAVVVNVSCDALHTYEACDGGSEVAPMVVAGVGVAVAVTLYLAILVKLLN